MQKFPIASVIRNTDQNWREFFVSAYNDGTYSIIMLDDSGKLSKFVRDEVQAPDIENWTLTDKKPKPSWLSEVRGLFTLKELLQFAPYKWKTDKPVAFKLVPGDAGLKKIIAPYIGHDELRPVMSHVFFDESGATATDAHVLLHIAGKVPKKDHGIFDLQGRPSSEEMKYPNYRAVIPKKNENIHKVDPALLYNWCRLMLAAHVPNSVTHQLAFSYGKDKKAIGFNARFMEKTALTMMQLGGKDWYFHLSEPNRAGVFVNHNGTINEDDDSYALLMPVMILDTSSTSVTENGSEDNGPVVKAFFDINKNTVVENGNPIDLEALVTGKSAAKAAPKAVKVSSIKPKVDGKSKRKDVWNSTVSEYTGVQEPNAGFDASVSLAQLNTMSEASKRDRLKKRVKENQEIREKYNVAYQEWNKDLLSAYDSQLFSLGDVINFNDNDAFVNVVKERYDLSPFKMRQADRWRTEEEKLRLNRIKSASSKPKTELVKEGPLKIVHSAKKGEKVQLKEILIHWAEGKQKHDFPITVKSWKDANAIAMQYLEEDGGYNKMKFTAIFDDGETYDGRLDISPREDNPTLSQNVFGRHIKDYLEYLKDKDKATSPETKMEVGEWLQKYDLGPDLSRELIYPERKPEPEEKKTGYKFEGNKWKATADLSLTEIAKLIRKDLKEAFPKMKWSVVKRNYNALTVEGSDYPVNPFSDEFMKRVAEGFTDNTIWQEFSGRRGDVYNEAFKKTKEKAEAIIQAYNYDDSDSMTDYFNVRFYGHATIDDKEWRDKVFAEKKEEVKPKVEKPVPAAKPEPKVEKKPHANKSPEKRAEAAKAGAKGYLKSELTKALRGDYKNLTQAQVLEKAQAFHKARQNSGAARDEQGDSKKRLSPTPENLVRWMNNPGGFDLIGVDTYKKDDATANLKIKNKVWWHRLGIKL